MSLRQNSWKTIQFDAVAATVKRLDLEKVFDDNNFHRPNFIQIKNINTSDILYVGDNNTVSSTNYRLSINPLATGKSINIDGYSDIYILIASNTTKLELNYAIDPDPSATDVDGTQDITIINQSLTVSNVGITSIAAGTNTIGKIYITDGSNDMGIESNGSINVNLQAGDNNVGNVDLASSIPSGSNIIGSVGVTQGGNTMVVESDGSINVNGATFSGTIGTVKLEDETGTYFLNIDSSGFITSKLSGSIPAGSNNIGDVDIASSLPAGSNNIGDVDIASALPAGSNNIGKVTIDDVDAGEIDKPSTTMNVHNVTCTTAGTEYSQALTANTKKFTIGIQSKSPDVTWVLKDGTGGTEFSLNGAETYTVDNVYLSSLTLYFETDTNGEVMQIIDWS